MHVLTKSNDLILGYGCSVGLAVQFALGASTLGQPQLIQSVIFKHNPGFQKPQAKFTQSPNCTWSGHSKLAQVGQPIETADSTTVNGDHSS